MILDPGDQSIRRLPGLHRPFFGAGGALPKPFARYFQGRERGKPRFTQGRVCDGTSETGHASASAFR